MQRDFDNSTLLHIIELLERRSQELRYTGDISDCGNEIGIIIGQAYPNMSESELKDFIHGIKHGVSLTNGKH